MATNEIRRQELNRMIRKPLEQITVQDILDLIEAKALEGKALEYKERLYPLARGRDEAAERLRTEVLRDVSSFANADGGDIIFGISDQVELVGLRDDDDPDGFVDRLTHIVDSHITPKIGGIRHRLISCGDKTVLIVRIPRSYAAPHMIGETTNSFWARGATGKRPLDIAELRGGFTMAAVLGDRLREERLRRLTLIQSGAGPIQLEHPTRVILHVFPLTAFAGNGLNLMTDQIATLKRSHRLKTFHAGNLGSESWMLNFDGVLTYQRTEGGTPQAYTQLFRSGAIEAVDSTFFWESPKGKIFYRGYEGEVVAVANSYLDLLQSLEVHPPYVLALSLLNVKDFAMPQDYGHTPGHSIKETDLVLPDIEIETWPIDLYTVFKPVFDLVWQAMGMDRSANYNHEGHWAPPRR